MSDAPSTMPVNAPAGAAPQPHRPGRVRRVLHDPLLALLAFASIGAGLIHVAVVPEHRDWWLTVVFFSLLAAFQIVWGLCLLVRRMPRPVLLLGAAGNFGALVAWVLSRAEGMPFGPSSGVPEAIGRADVLASVLGAVVVLGAGKLAGGWQLASRMLHRRPALATGGSALAVSAVSLLALTGVSGHAHGDGDAHPHGESTSSHEPAGPGPDGTGRDESAQTRTARTGTATACTSDRVVGAPVQASVAGRHTSDGTAERQCGPGSTSTADRDPGQAARDESDHPADGHAH